MGGLGGAAFGDDYLATKGVAESNGQYTSPRAMLHEAGGHVPGLRYHDPSPDHIMQRSGGGMLIGKFDPFTQSTLDYLYGHKPGFDKRKDSVPANAASEALQIQANGTDYVIAFPAGAHAREDTAAQAEVFGTAAYLVQPLESAMPPASVPTLRRGRECLSAPPGRPPLRMRVMER